MFPNLTYVLLTFLVRYQGTIFGNVLKSPTRNNGEREDDKTGEIDDKKLDFSLDDVKFSFEMEPKSEPWYQTFVRQDRGEEHYMSLSDPGKRAQKRKKPLFYYTRFEFIGYQTRLILPYQLSTYLPPLDPKYCIARYDRIKNYLLHPDNDDSQPGTSTSGSGMTVREYHHRRRKRKSRFVVKSNHPRKSPRQHASTLAILSSLLHQRKRRERKAERESDASRSSLGVIPEEESASDAAKVEEISREILVESIATAKHISEILTAPINIDMGSDEVEGIVLKDKPDAIELLQNYSNVQPRNLVTPGLSESVRTVRRRKKKNRTGI